MALTVTIDDMRPCPFFLTGTIDFDSSYPTGGESLDLSDYFSAVYGVMIEMKGGNDFEFDDTNALVLAYVTSSGAQVSDTTDLSAVTGVRFIAWGKPA